MNFIPDVRYDFQTPNIVTLAVKVVTLLSPLLPLQLLSDSIGYGYRRGKGKRTACKALGALCKGKVQKIK